ncbi:type III-B CRISPR-associated protein Cas10/Cmr2 [[Phormidium ambiguum] IAM M-71]|uniref:Type III-B CRISPR-associated protein Cas10/Cmr2 n=1 Tax=[Phormidium ambiguum] IAM M-71 TaxID=454136 RepID=A0A1U7IB94_9CYAN|nr:type III-B CRISPR-associated protein Cas10/Cmr2 [Phormidium ambiguum]OKH33819.1 type III-B CRISPR-associated protein Cas10/Cmr2 [Phormidium ambiguum IAM M-71]
MSHPYWQAKIWGLLHDPVFKALHDNSGRGLEGAWETLKCMEGWVSPKQKSAHKTSEFSSKWLNTVGLCDLIASASDRAAVGRLPNIAIDYDDTGLQIRHLLSGEPQTLKLGQWHDYLISLGETRKDWLATIEEISIPDSIKQEENPQKVFWWLWRCYPVVLSKALERSQNIPQEPSLPLLPADTRIPDGSLWSHASMTAALAGALAGYDKQGQTYPKKYQRFTESRPHLAIFTFSPVQELIKASRKMRDFWAGSWLLHYLSAKVCWAIANKYGPDSLLYPCLYEQPLIDHWLLETYSQDRSFTEVITQPKASKLLTAGFPNVLVFILPDNGASQSPNAEKNPVKSAMAYAEQVLREEWKNLGDGVLNYLKDRHWMPNINPNTWDGWLKAQWQTYWVALPLGNPETVLHHSPRKAKLYEQWTDKQNEFACPKENLFVEPEKQFIQAVFKAALQEDWQNRRSSKQSYKAKQPNLNVGSWWASIFDQTRLAMNAIKNARNWQLPTAFGPRSTVSGLGPVVHPQTEKKDWITEKETKECWQNRINLFDGIEQLNATETLKRGLHKILPDLLHIKEAEMANSYPDLTAGVAGYLKVANSEHLEHFNQACQEIIEKFDFAQKVADEMKAKWGIPWADNKPQKYHPRLLNVGWLIEDAPEEDREKTRLQLTQTIDHYYPNNNPTDWYILAAGDGDSMGNWLQGEKLDNYRQYIPDALSAKLNKTEKEVQEKFKKFLEVKKRMGPSTHSALSRALLDFSNQLIPYITEERYAGRLIYSGGDDVLAYTNLWEWDNWLWDIRQCFQGNEDPQKQFSNDGNYWQSFAKNLPNRPLFTMGKNATISFGIVIASQGVPLAIALENLWSAEEEAKEHKYHSGCFLTNKNAKDFRQKDAVQVRILYSNGNILKATAKFDTFQEWKKLLTVIDNLEPAIFEQAAQIWQQHPAPEISAIAPWTKAFCSRRDFLKEDKTLRDKFQNQLADFSETLWRTTAPEEFDREMQTWLKIAAFTLRNRQIDF